MSFLKEYYENYLIVSLIKNHDMFDISYLKVVKYKEYNTLIIETSLFIGPATILNSKHQNYIYC